MRGDRYPRSLSEAFGPYTSQRIDEPRRRTPVHEWALYVVAVVATVLWILGVI